MASKSKQDPFVRCFEVCDPKLHPKGHTIYRVVMKTIKVDATEEDVTEIVVWRRYNDFKKLYKAMMTLHRALHRKEEFPPFVRSTVFGRFDKAVLDERQLCAQDLLNFVGQRHYLVNSKAFRQFFEGAEETQVTKTGDFLQPIRKNDSLKDLQSCDSEETLDSSSLASNDLDLDLPVQTLNIDGKILDIQSQGLSGIWQYRQIADAISLNEDDNAGEDTDFTDESALNTPLPDTEISFFDPLQSPSKEEDEEASMQEPYSNTWLLTAMSACEQIAEENGDGVQNTRQNNADEEGQRETNQNSTSVLSTVVDVPAEDNSDLVDHKNGSDHVAQHKNTETDPKEEDSNQTETFHTSELSQNDWQNFDPLRARSSSGSAIEIGKGDDNFSLLSTPVKQEKKSQQQTRQELTTPDEEKITKKVKTPSPKQSPNKSGLRHVEIKDKSDYIYQAASHISFAQQCEANGNYHNAFNYYKNGVGILLTGVQKDDIKARREVVKKKTARYLMKAEEIFKTYLSRKDIQGDRWDTGQMSPAKVLDPTIAMLQGPAEELKNYTVLGIIDKVLLVMDKSTDKTFVIKVLHKSCSQTEKVIRSRVPVACPYMVEIYKFYETDVAIYLLLQHASGGKLWSYISAYLHQMNDSIIEDPLHDKHEQKLRTPKTVDEGETNIYSGQQLSTSDLMVQLSGNTSHDQSHLDTKGGQSPGSDPDLKAQPECVTGFAKLFTSENGADSANVKFDAQTSAIQYRKASDCDFLDDSKDFQDTQPVETTKKRNVGRSISFEETAHQVEPAAQFEDILKGTKPSLEYFSINSFDSDGPAFTRFDSTTSDHIESIPEVSELTPSHSTADFTDLKKSSNAGEVFSEDVLEVSVIGKQQPVVTLSERNENKDEIQDHRDHKVGDLEALISSSKKLLQHVDEVLKESNHDLDFNSEVVEFKADDAISSTPLKKFQPDTATEQVLENSYKSNEIEEPSIYDLHKSETMEDSSDSNEMTTTPLKFMPSTATIDTTQNTITEDKPITNTTNAKETATKGCKSRVFRMTSQERSLDAELKHRHRTMSGAFVELDLADGIKEQAGVVHIPESCIKQWAAEIITAVSRLHAIGLICRDLRPANLLLGERGHILLTFFSEWNAVDHNDNQWAVDHLYSAPEVGGVFPVGPVCDWWSLGVILFELLTGKTLISSYPSGITSHTQLTFPDHVTSEAQALLNELLRTLPKERLGGGSNGVEEIKSHPFFNGIDWETFCG